MPAIKIPPQFVLIAYTSITLIIFIAVASMYSYECA